MSEQPLEILATKEMSDLAQRVYKNLREKDSQFGYAELQSTTFANGEIKVKIPETVRHKEVYLFHHMQFPDPNTSLVQLLLTVDALSRASVENINLVLPYMTYSRQDRKDEPRVPISARLLANMVESYGKVEKLLTLDLHAEQIQGFYNIPVDNLYGSLVHAEYFRNLYQNDFSNVVVYSPDFGGAVRARRFARSLDEKVRTYPVEKIRTGPNKAEVLNFLGDPAGKEVIIYDDMIDTGGSILATAQAAYARGAKKVYCVATHGLFSSKAGDVETAEQRFRNAGIEVVITDSIPRPKEYLEENASWLTVFPLDGILTRAISESAKVGGSVSKLFEKA